MFHVLELKCVTCLCLNTLSSLANLSRAACAASGTKEFCGGLEIGDTGRKPADFLLKFSFFKKSAWRENKYRFGQFLDTHLELNPELWLERCMSLPLGMAGFVLNTFDLM